MTSQTRGVLVALVCLVALTGTLALPIAHLKKDLASLEAMLQSSSESHASAGQLPCNLPSVPVVSREPTEEMVLRYFPVPPGDKYLQSVYKQHMKNSIRRAKSSGDRMFATGLSDSLTGVLQCRSGDSVDNCPEASQLQFAKPGIDSARRLLADCNAAIRSSGERLSISSGYRPTCHQYRTWVKLFNNKYRARDCDNGRAAVWKCAGKVSANYAFPGFSLHNTGAALDFVLRKGGKSLGASTSASNKAAWKQTEAWKWLTENHSKYNFAPLSSEPWHWNYQLDLAAVAAASNGGAAAPAAPTSQPSDEDDDDSAPPSNTNNYNNNNNNNNNPAPTPVSTPLPTRELTAVDWAWNALSKLKFW